jgi:hypothetical protein
MAFSIELFSDVPDHWDGGECAYDGRIVLGDYSERISADGSYWNAHDYRRHWRQAIADILSGEPKVALITGIADPLRSSLLWWWPLYASGETVYVHNGLLLFERLHTPFDAEHPSPSVPDRATSSEGELPPSEWQVTMADLREFLAGQ